VQSVDIEVTYVDIRTGVCTCSVSREEMSTSSSAAQGPGVIGQGAAQRSKRQREWEDFGSAGSVASESSTQSAHRKCPPQCVCGGLKQSKATYHRHKQVREAKAKRDRQLSTALSTARV